MSTNKLKQALLVDDDPDFAYLVQAALADCQTPCDLKILSSGTELLDWLEINAQPSVIFLDISMPYCSGFDLLNILKITDHYKTIPVVMLTTLGHSDDVKKAYAYGANAYVIKPMSFGELQRRMEALSYYWIDRTEKLDGTDQFKQLLARYKRAGYEFFQKWRQGESKPFSIDSSEDYGCQISQLIDRPLIFKLTTSIFF